MEENMAQPQRTKTIVPPNSPERWGGVDPKAPPPFEEPKDPALLEYVHDARTAIITFNRPQAGNTDCAKVVAMRDERRLRELVLGAYNGGGRYVGAWAQAEYEPMGEVMVRA
jgi:hypothetical protein